MQGNVIMSMPYLPCIAWVQHACAYPQVILEAHEHYSKQSYRNRARILSSNGVLNLNIPVLHQSGKQIITSVQTDANENWKRHHWQTIISAYSSSAFFMHYRHYFEPYFTDNSHVNLWDHNMGLLNLIFKILKQPVRFESTSMYEKIPTECIDLRSAFNSKNSNPLDELLVNKIYHQVFSQKFSFEPNLSIIDLIFNTGPAAPEYLSA